MWTKTALFRKRILKFPCDTLNLNIILVRYVKRHTTEYTRHGGTNSIYYKRSAEVPFELTMIIIHELRVVVTILGIIKSVKIHWPASLQISDDYIATGSILDKNRLKTKTISENKCSRALFSPFIPGPNKYNLYDIKLLKLEFTRLNHSCIIFLKSDIAHEMWFS